MATLDRLEAAVDVVVGELVDLGALALHLVGAELRGVHDDAAIRLEDVEVVEEPELVVGLGAGVELVGVELVVEDAQDLGPHGADGRDAVVGVDAVARLDLVDLLRQQRQVGACASRRRPR